MPEQEYRAIGAQRDNVQQGHMVLCMGESGLFEKIGNQCNGWNASTMCSEYLLLFRTLAAEF